MIIAKYLVDLESGLRNILRNFIKTIMLLLLMCINNQKRVREQYESVSDKIIANHIRA